SLSFSHLLAPRITAFLLSPVPEVSGRLSFFRERSFSPRGDSTYRRRFPNRTVAKADSKDSSRTPTRCPELWLRFESFSRLPDRSAAFLRVPHHSLPRVASFLRSRPARCTRATAA